MNKNRRNSDHPIDDRKSIAKGQKKIKLNQERKQFKKTLDRYLVDDLEDEKLWNTKEKF